MDQISSNYLIKSDLTTLYLLMPLSIFKRCDFSNWPNLGINFFGQNFGLYQNQNYLSRYTTKQMNFGIECKTRVSAAHSSFWSMAKISQIAHNIFPTSYQFPGRTKYQKFGRPFFRFGILSQI